VILVETTTIHLLDRKQSLHEDQYWRQRQGYGKLSLGIPMITMYPDVWRRTVPSAATGRVIIQD
jgi:hypothetical protein